MSDYLFIPVLTIITGEVACYIVWNEFHAFLPRFAKCFLMMTASLIIWALAFMVTLLAKSAEVAFWADAVQAVMIVASTSLILVFIGFAAGVRLITNTKWAKYGMLTVTFVFAIIAFRGLMVKEMVPTAWGYWPRPDIGFYLMSLYAFAMTSLASFICVQMSMQDTAPQSRQLGKLLLMALLMPMAAGFGIDVTLRSLNIIAPTTTVAFIGLTSLLLAFALIKYRILEMEPSVIMRQMSDHLHDAMIVTDSTGCIIYTNVAADRLFGDNRSFVNQPITNYLESRLVGDSLESETVHNASVMFRPSADTELGLSLNTTNFNEGGRHFRIYMLRQMSQAERLAEKLRESTAKLLRRETELAMLNHDAVQRELEISRLKKILDEASGQ